MKINNKEVIGKQFAYDGCHKIYIIEDLQDKEELIFCYDEMIKSGMCRNKEQEEQIKHFINKHIITRKLT